jgi:hypothetical protein
MEVTRQDVFNAAWNGLKAQGFVRTDEFKGPAISAKVSLVRGAPAALDGRMCAFAHAESICDADGFYDALGAAGIDALIDCHQLATSPEDMERRMREFAATYNLTIPDDGFSRFMEKLQEPVTEPRHWAFGD